MGDDAHSFGADGHRILKWSNGESKFGSAWKEGDIIGVAANLHEGNKSFSFSVNGNWESPNGLAFENVKADLPWISPGLTS